MTEDWEKEFLTWWLTEGYKLYDFESAQESVFTTQFNAAFLGWQGAFRFMKENNSYGV